MALTKNINSATKRALYSEPQLIRDFFKVWFCYHQWNGPTNHYLLLLHFYSDSCSKFVTNTINIICIWVLHILPKAHWIPSKCTASIRTINNRTTVLWSYFPPPTISFAWFKSCNQIPIGKIFHLWEDWKALCLCKCLVP